MSNELNLEMSLSELEGELCAELPQRNLMRRRCRCRRHYYNRGYYGGGYGNGYYGGNGGAFASFGSAANSNSTYQVNFNPQIAINNGNAGGISIDSHNVNSNVSNQTALPINFGL